MAPMIRIVMLAALLAIAPGLARASSDLAAAAAGLTGAGFKQTAAAIDAIAATGDLRAAGLLEALAEGRVFRRKADRALVIGTRQGGRYRLDDPFSGDSLGQATSRELTKIRVNNRLRKRARAAVAALELFHPTPARRRAAADALFKAGDPEMAPLIDRALAAETDTELRARLELVRAGIDVRHADSADIRRAAVTVLGAYAEPEVRALLVRVAEDETVAADLRATARDAANRIDKTLAYWRVVGNLFQGVSLGSVLLLAAVGLAITFGVMGVINMAHGELVMLGAYTTFMVQEAFRTYAPEAFGWSLSLAVPAAFLVSGAVGVAIERGVIRHLYGRPLETLLATWGISLVLQQSVRSIFGPTNREVGSPDWMSGAFETSAGLVLTYNRVAIIFFSLAVLAGLGLLLRRSSFGLQMRAVTQNRAMAGAMGIHTGRVDALTFGLGSGIAGIAGVALSQIDNVSPNLGQAYIVDSFMVVVFGGVGNLWGTLVGALSLGVVNKLLEPVAGAVLGKILVLVAVILFIQKRPRGLFALRGRAVES